MKLTWTSRLHARFDTGACWPIPDHERVASHETLGWRMRYTPEQLTQSDRYYAASVIDCYSLLVELSGKASGEILKALRAAVKMRDEESYVEMATCGAVDVDDCGREVEP